MLEKKSVIASAILAGLVSGIALADEAATAAPAADQGGTKVEPKNEIKGHKKGTKGHKMHKKGDKDACSGANGCDGKDMKKDTAAK